MRGQGTQAADAFLCRLHTRCAQPVSRGPDLVSLRPQRLKGNNPVLWLSLLHEWQPDAVCQLVA